MDRLKMVGATGFEPATSRPPDERATRLRYAPKRKAEGDEKVAVIGTKLNS